MDGRRPHPAARIAVEALEGRALLNGAGYTPPAPPRVVEIARVGTGAQWTAVYVQFDQDLQQATVRAGNFQFLQPNRNASFNRGTPDVIPTRFAGFRPTGTVDGVVQYDYSTVVLVPRDRLNQHRTYQLTINGNFTGVASQFGVVLDGDGDGRPGGMFTAILRGPGPWRPNPGPARR
jgi:hypothetical protein